MKTLINHRIKVIGLMTALFLVLFVLHIAHLYWLKNTGEYLQFFDFNSEENLPTAFATFNLFFAGCLLFYISTHKTPQEMKWRWFILAVIFFFLAFDEYAMVHDPLSRKLRPYVSDVDLLHFAWVIPYSILLLVFTLAYLRFFFALPRKYMILFGASGFIFVLGAVGFELIGAPRTKNFGRSDIYYTVFTTVEECLEFIGIILFNYALLTYLKEKVTLLKRS